MSFTRIRCRLTLLFTLVLLLLARSGTAQDVVYATGMNSTEGYGIQVIDWSAPSAAFLTFGDEAGNGFAEKLQALAAAPDGSRLYATRPLPGCADVVAIDPRTNTIVARIPFDHTPPSGGIAVSADGTRLFVPHTMAPDAPYGVAIVDTSTNVIIGDVALPALPRNVAVRPYGSEIYVSLRDTVAIVNTATQTIEATIPVGLDPRALKFTPDGLRVYVANNRSSSVSVLDAETRTTITTIPIAQEHPLYGADDLVMAPDGGHVYVSCSFPPRVVVISAVKNIVIATVKLSALYPKPISLGLSSDGSRLFVTDDVNLDYQSGMRVRSLDTSSYTWFDLNEPIDQLEGSLAVVRFPRCVTSVSSPPAIGGSGGSGGITVTAPPGCYWTAGATPPWIAITSGSSGTGPGTVSFTVTANPTLQNRRGLITIQGFEAAIAQSAAIPNPLGALDTPAGGSMIPPGTPIRGWAIDRSAPVGTGVSRVGLRAYSTSKPGVSFDVFTSYGDTRNDIGAAFGTQFTPSGFSARLPLVPPDSYVLWVSPTLSNGATFSIDLWTLVYVAPGAYVHVDTPANSSRLPGAFAIGGWAVDLRATGTDPGVDSVRANVYPEAGGSGEPVVSFDAPLGIARPDVAAVLGDGRYTNSGFNLAASSVPPGEYRIELLAHSTVSGVHENAGEIRVTVTRVRMALDTISPGASVMQPFLLGGWVIDEAATTNSGVDQVAFYATGTGWREGPVFLGSASYGVNRPDVAGVFGPQFNDSGYNLVVRGLLTDRYEIVGYAHRTVTGEWTKALSRTVLIYAGPILINVDTLQDNATVTGPFGIGGWALNRSALHENGIVKLYVYAWCASCPLIPSTVYSLGYAELGVARPDVAAAFGAQFGDAGFALGVSGLPPGVYDIVFEAASTTGQVASAVVHHVTVH